MNTYAIYPKQFKDLKHKIDETTCFIIMPFHKRRKYVYEKIKEAIHDCGLNYDRSDELKKSSPFVNKIISSIASAYYLIVDISGLNANVLYELGIAHTLRDVDRVLILKDTKTECPSDLKHINYFAYDINNTQQLYDHVVTFLKNNHYVNDLKELLLLLNIIDNTDNSNYALTILQNELSSRCITLIHLLNNLMDDISERECNEILITLFDLTRVNIEHNNQPIADIFLKLLCLLLRKLPCAFDLSRFVATAYNNAEVDEEEQIILNFRTEIAVELLKFEHDYNELYNWIKLFLYKSSPASVDIARYKLHVGFINSSSNRIKKFLLNILTQESNCTLIEHSLNLCRVKSIKESVTSALEIISNNDNPYVFRSGIDLIVDIGTISQQEKMFEIIETKNNFIEKNSFIKIHIERAELKRNK